MKKMDQQTIGTYRADIDEDFSELAYIISQMQKVRRLTSLQVTDDLLLDAAVRLHITTQINNQRPKGKNGKIQSKPDVMATERQLKYLRSLGASIPERLSKAQASQIIERLKEENIPKDGERAKTYKSYAK